MTPERAIAILTPGATHYTPAEYAAALAMARNAIAVAEKYRGYLQEQCNSLQASIDAERQMMELHRYFRA
jgi:hypothetical protein